MSKRYLVLSDERCGGTNLVKSLAQHPDINVPEVEETQELFNRFPQEPKCEHEWLSCFQRFWNRQDLWHVQRCSIRTGTGGWTALAKLRPRVICLYRENLELQYLSFMHARAAWIFHGERTPLSSAWWSPEEYGRWCGQWTVMRRWAKKHLPAELCIWLSYEELEADWGAKIIECQRHLQVDPIAMGQAMAKPTPLDYFTIFNVTREEMQSYRSSLDLL